MCIHSFIQLIGDQKIDTIQQSWCFCMMMMANRIQIDVSCVYGFLLVQSICKKKEDDNGRLL